MRRITTNNDPSFAVRLRHLRLHFPWDATEEIERDIAAECYTDDLATAFWRKRGLGMDGWLEEISSGTTPFKV